MIGLILYTGVRITFFVCKISKIQMKKFATTDHAFAPGVSIGCVIGLEMDIDLRLQRCTGKMTQTTTYTPIAVIKVSDLRKVKIKGQADKIEVDHHTKLYLHWLITSSSLSDEVSSSPIKASMRNSPATNKT